MEERICEPGPLYKRLRSSSAPISAQDRTTGAGLTAVSTTQFLGRGANDGLTPATNATSAANAPTPPESTITARDMTVVTSATLDRTTGAGLTAVSTTQFLGRGANDGLTPTTNATSAAYVPTLPESTITARDMTVVTSATLDRTTGAGLTAVSTTQFLGRGANDGLTPATNATSAAYVPTPPESTITARDMTVVTSATLGNAAKDPATAKEMQSVLQETATSKLALTIQGTTIIRTPEKQNDCRSLASVHVSDRRTFEVRSMEGRIFEPDLLFKRLKSRSTTHTLPKIDESAKSNEHDQSNLARKSKLKKRCPTTFSVRANVCESSDDTEDDSSVELRMKGSKTSLAESRRPIKPVNSHDFSQLSADVFLEFDAKYLGDVPGVSMETDTTNRTEVLKIIDRGKKQGLVPLQLNFDHDAIIAISKLETKISRHDSQEDLLLKMSVNEIAQVCYVNDDGIHILAIKHGTPEMLNLAVLHCDSQVVAETICSCVSDCFDLVYTDVVIALIQDTIDVAIPEGSRAGSVSTGDTPTDSRPFIFSSSNPSLAESVYRGGGPSSDISRNSTESSQAELLREYMWQLKTKLTPSELATFSSLLKRWNYSSEKLHEFCERLYELYGHDRKYLLAGMFPFIPVADCQYFESFLQKHDVSLLEDGHATLNSIPGRLPHFYTRSISDISISSNHANDLDLTARANDFDTVIDAMGRNLEKIEASVGEPAQKYMADDKH